MCHNGWLWTVAATEAHICHLSVRRPTLSRHNSAPLIPYKEAKLVKPHSKPLAKITKAFPLPF